METPHELRQLLEKIFADSLVDPVERAELMEAKKGLPPSEVSRVFVHFLEEKWGKALEDGRLSASERSLLSRIVDELEIHADHLPEHMRVAMPSHAD